jgi:hypothetical protein
MDEVLAYLVASVGGGRSSADLRAGIELGMAPEDYERGNISSVSE